MLLLSPEALEDFEGLGCKDTEKADAVVVGLAPTEFHYDRLNAAFRYLVITSDLSTLLRYFKSQMPHGRCTADRHTCWKVLQT